MSRRALTRIALISAVLAIPALFAAAAPAEEIIAGPVQAEVIRVIDGDTFVAEARIWPGHKVKVSVRIRGIDAPETRTRCTAEKAAGMRSLDALEALLDGATVAMTNISGDKFFGRVLADVATEEEGSIARNLLTRALARPYEGGKRVSYCG